MGIAIANSTMVGPGLTGSPTTGDYAVPAGASRYLLVFTWFGIDDGTYTSLSYGGVAMTLLRQIAAVNSGAMAMWGLANPLEGTNTLSCVRSNFATGLTFYCITLTQVRQTDSVFDHDASAPSNAITWSTEPDGIGFLCSPNTFTWTGSSSLFDDVRVKIFYKLTTGADETSASTSYTKAACSLRVYPPSGPPISVTPLVIH